MFVQLKKFIVTEGNAEKVVNQFSGEGMLEKQEGFIDVTVMEKKVRRGDEEVMVMIRWESEEYWKQWEKSEAHIAGHRAKLGKPKPEHIISSEGGLYHIKAVKNAVN
ncbi:antibiotic biosynthesis monooxygenase [Neobacillus cucumis]|uniref:antibiotic biosynthesis monooxygenase n=1 Tax=Neobacillus cucumis TaxID=1740721 RepID=UPI001963FE25|nr:antibiotic biosynthesis monooxygenase [Neobacillus cucumis]MBM7651088.1 heme oxygenase (staphylobilin-producing) [Neobacillus cucumis]